MAAPNNSTIRISNEGLRKSGLRLYRPLIFTNPGQSAAAAADSFSACIIASIRRAFFAE